MLEVQNPLVDPQSWVGRVFSLTLKGGKKKVFVAGVDTTTVPGDKRSRKQKSDIRIINLSTGGVTVFPVGYFAAGLDSGSIKLLESKAYQLLNLIGKNNGSSLLSY